MKAGLAHSNRTSLHYEMKGKEFPLVFIFEAESTLD